MELCEQGLQTFNNLHAVNVLFREKEEEEIKKKGGGGGGTTKYDTAQV